jgi:hypothetical protein
LLLVIVRCLRHEVRQPPWYFLLLTVFGALASDLNHSTLWAYSNCFMPVAVFTSLYGAMLVAELLEPAGDRIRDGRLAALALAAALLIQLVALAYDPRAQIPNTADRRAVQSIERTLRRFPSPIFIPGHPLYSYLRDGTIHTHAMGFGDVRDSGGIADFSQVIASGKYRTIVLEDYIRNMAGFSASYVRAHTFQYEGRALTPRTGYQVRPAVVLVRRSSFSSP